MQICKKKKKRKKDKETDEKKSVNSYRVQAVQETVS